MKIDKEEFFKGMDDGELFREWLYLCSLYVLVSREGDNRERPMFEKAKPGEQVSDAAKEMDAILDSLERVYAELMTRPGSKLAALVDDKERYERYVESVNAELPESERLVKDTLPCAFHMSMRRMYEKPKTYKPYPTYSFALTHGLWDEDSKKRFGIPEGKEPPTPI